MSKAMLDACDALGMLVWEETFDTWLHSKTVHDDSTRFEAQWEQDLQAMVAKDYNHPSVAFYCIGNEIEELARPEGAHISRRLVNTLRKLDDTRYITNAINGQQSVVGANGLAMLKEMGVITKEHIKALTGSEEADDMQIAQAFMAHLASGNVNDMMTALSGELGRVIEHPSVGEKLEELTQLPVVMWDERRTTVSASAVLTENGTFGKKRKEQLDAVAAVIILENYLQRRKHEAQQSGT